MKDHSSSLKRYIYFFLSSRSRSIFSEVGLVGLGGAISIDSSLWSSYLALSLSSSFLVNVSSSSRFFLIFPSFQSDFCSSCFQSEAVCRSSLTLLSLSSFSLSCECPYLTSFLSSWLSNLNASFSLANLQFSLLTKPIVSLILISLSYSSSTKRLLACCCSSFCVCYCQKLNFAKPTSQAILFYMLRIKFSYSLTLSLDQSTDFLNSSAAFLRYSYKLAFSLEAVAYFIYISSILERALAYHPCIFSFKFFSFLAKSSTSIFSFCLILSNFLLYVASISAAYDWNLMRHSSPTFIFILWAQNCLNLASYFQYQAFSSVQLWPCAEGEAI